MGIDRDNTKNYRGDVEKIRKGVEITLCILGGIIDFKRTWIKVAVGFPVNMAISLIKAQMKAELTPEQWKKFKKALTEALDSTKMNVLTGVTLLNLSEQAPNISARTLAQFISSLGYRSYDQIMRNIHKNGKAMAYNVIVGAGPIVVGGCAAMAIVSAIMKDIAVKTGNDDWTKIYGNIINIALGTTTRLLTMYSQTPDYKDNLNAAGSQIAKYTLESPTYRTCLQFLRSAGFYV